MKYIADLHIHSHYSRATSKKLDPEHLFIWAQRKGLQVVATGDISHPQWLAELREKLQPAAGAEGLFVLKEPLARSVAAEVPAACRSDVHFLLSGEISSIYKKDGEVRKVHNVVFFPSLDAVQKFQNRLERIGNIRSDGRPILGLDSRHLLEIVLETDPAGALIPAHIWTPWFSLLGSQSGFDSVEACYDDLTPYIFALETGLSSDPAMNWRLSQLDRFNLVSNSDAHSPENLAREANVFETGLDYHALFTALKDKNSKGFWGTLEFFPEEGKYHMDGHRKCNKMMRPPETIRNNGLCPVCGKPAVLGVSYRVEELADREEGHRPKNAKAYTSLVPLPEVLAEVLQVGDTSKKVRALYESLLHKLGNELGILQEQPLAEIARNSNSLVSEAIERMRSGRVDAQPGYDGEYGVIRLFKEGEREKIMKADALFSVPAAPSLAEAPVKEKLKPGRKKKAVVQEQPAAYGLNPEQQQAVQHRGAPLIIQAGPGTGKTRTLTHWLADLIRSSHISAQTILAITFTNKAAREMRERLAALLGEEISREMVIATFHAFGLLLLRQTHGFFGRNASFRIVQPENDPAFLASLHKRHGERFLQNDLDRISLIKGQLYDPDNLPPTVSEQLGESFLRLFRNYEALLMEWNAVDMDDLINLPVRLLRNDVELRRKMLQRFSVVAVDEFQDINQAQYEFFRIFAMSCRETCVIGDPDQSIYGFRGAGPHYFQQFQDDLPNSRLIKLTHNYRSSQTILDAAAQVLGRERSDLQAHRHDEAKINLFPVSSDRAEAELVVKQIEELLAGTTHFSMDSGRVQRGEQTRGFAFGDIAILIRSRNQLPLLIEALSRSGIPYESVQELPLAQAELTQLVLAACSLRLKSEQNDALHNYFLNRPSASSAQQDLTEFCRTIQALPEHATVCSILDEVHKVQAGDDEQEQLFKKLYSLAVAFDDRVQAFMDAILLQKDADHWDERADRVRILTLHAAKGLEFPVVFITGCEEGILPFAFANRAVDVEEERRLFYVGMTRSCGMLYLTYAKTRLQQGQRLEQTSSRFLSAIAEKLVQKHRLEIKTKRGAGQLKLF